MTFEIGERVIFRSLHWEVTDNASESILQLYGRSRENAGRTAHVIPGLEPIERAEVPQLTWTLGAPAWDHTAWKALHDAYRLTLSHGRGHLGAVDWGRLVLEPCQVQGVRPIERSVDGQEDEAAEVVHGYCAAVRSALTDDSRPPLDVAGIILHGRLTDIVSSLDRAE